MCADDACEQGSGPLPGFGLVKSYEAAETAPTGKSNDRKRMSQMSKLSLRPCRICDTSNNPIFASEKPCAGWIDKPWMPEGHYTLIRCRSCGNLYVDSDVTETYLNDLQGKFNPETEDKITYESTEDDDKRRTLELAENWEMIAKIRRPAQNDKSLDYGCAWGAFGNIAKQAGVIPNGVELQPTGAAHSLKLWGGKSVVHRGPIETAPFVENEFQYITSFETLEHVFDPVRILKSLKHLLSTGGVIAISVPSADYFTFKYWVYRKQPFHEWMRRKFPGNMQGDMVLIHNHINTFSLDAARLIMEKAGLKVVFIAPYCSGLRGGLLGKIIKYMGKLIWLLSLKKIILAPSIFVVAQKKLINAIL